ncbi:MAG: right-handed parallel beta-helix repeat-containing protein, partial [Smithella sp.]
GVMKVRHIIKILICITIAATLYFPSTSFAGKYWVSPTGTSAWTGCQGTTDPGKYCSLATANSSAIAGDTIYMKAGTYNYSKSGTGAISPARSGVKGSPITYSRIATANKPLINCTNSTSGANLASRSYVKLDGIKFNVTYPGYGISLIGAGHYNEIVNCELYGTPSVAIPIGVTGPSNHNWIHGNVITGKGGSGCKEGGDVMRIGGAWANFYSVNNTVEDNQFYHGGHALIDTYSTRYTVIRNNIAHNEPWWAGTSSCNGWSALYDNSAYNGRWGHRDFEIGFNNDKSNTYTLVEGNRTSFQSANPGNYGDANITIAGRGIVVRYNDSFSAQRMGMAFKWTNSSSNGLGGSNCRVYNNTVYHSGYGYKGGGGPATFRVGIYATTTSTPAGNVVKNNIIYDSVADFTSGFQKYVTTSDNLCTRAATGCTVVGDPLFTNKYIADPAGSTGSTSPDLTLQAASNAINKGAHLTTATNIGRSSTILTVKDVLYFQDGTWGSDLARSSDLAHHQPDTIAIGTVYNIVKIKSINYSTNTITLVSPISWASGDKIWLYQKSDAVRVLYGFAPDMGAHEYPR